MSNVIFKTPDQRKYYKQGYREGFITGSRAIAQEIRNGLVNVIATGTVDDNKQFLDTITRIFIKYIDDTHGALLVEFDKMTATDEPKKENASNDQPNQDASKGV